MESRMDSDNGTKLLSLAMTFALTMAGVLCPVLGVMNIFFDVKSELFTIICIAGIATGVFSCGFVLLSKRLYRVLMVALAFFALGIYCFYFRLEIAGGFMMMCNHIMFKLANYYHTSVACFLIPRELVEKGEMIRVFYVIVVLLPMLYAFCAGRQRVQFIPFVLSLCFLALPILLEIEVPAMVTGLQIANLIAWLVLNVAVIYHNRSTREYFSSQSVAGAVLAMLLVVSMIASLVIPKENFVHGSYWMNVQNRGAATFAKVGETISSYGSYVQREGKIFGYFRESNIRWADIFGDWGIPGNAPSNIGAGNLGQTDKLSFTNKEVLVVTAPESEFPIYLKGYYGSEYCGTTTNFTNAHWERDTDDEYWADVQSYQMDRYLAQIQIAENYEKSHVQYLNQTITESKVAVRYTGISHTRQFAPLYLSKPNVPCVRDEGIGIVPDGQAINCYLMSEEQMRELIIQYSWEDTDEERKNYQKYVHDHYTECNTPCAEELRALTAEMSARLELTSPAHQYMLACRIRNYLSENCTYTLEPGRAPVGRDFVEYFLMESKEGYCTYFASAAVMMLRSAGIPARYVEGYVFDTKGTNSVPVKELERRHSYVNVSVKDAAAHAWVEVYLDNFGWVDLEVTPGINQSLTDPEENPQPEKPSEEETTAKAPDETTKPSEEETTTRQEITSAENASNANTTHTSGESTSENTAVEENRTIDFTKLFSVLRVLLPILVGLMLCYGVMLLVRKRHERIREKYHQLCEREDVSQNDLVILNYQYFERIVRVLGFVREKTESYGDFAKRVAWESSIISLEEAQLLTEAYEHTCFSETIVDRETSVMTCQILDRVALRTYQSLGRLSALSFCYLRNLVD